MTGITAGGIIDEIMTSKEAILERLSHLEEEIAQLKRELEQSWRMSPGGKTVKKLTTLRGKFPALKALTEAEIDEATHIWERHAERTFREL